MKTTPCTYAAAHKRTTRARGKASAQLCIDCGQQAREWSYRGGSPREQVGQHRASAHGVVKFTVMAWSPDPGDYDPRCRSCHVAHDWTAEKRAELAEHVKSNPIPKREINVPSVILLEMMGVRKNADIANVLDFSVPTIKRARAKWKAERS